MNISQAKQLLGLPTESTPPLNHDAIQAALSEQQALLEEKISQAPTPALAEKFNQRRAQLKLAAELLLADTEPEAARHTHTHAPGLSQTMMADMPLSGTQFGAASFSATTLPVGHLLANRYRIEGVLGQGGMGVVYQAFDGIKEQSIAIKTLLPHLANHPAALSRFMAEAKLSSQLSHPNIVNVFDVQQDGEQVFLTMELLEGQNLRELIEARHAAQLPFEVDEALSIANALCDALSHAHKYTVHRDIKPENIWRDEEGGVKLMDFGIARVMSSTQRTQTGAATGTAYYMAPEQLKGTSKVDHRADIYALGVMLYELLAGEVPTGRFKSLRELNHDIPQEVSDAVDQALETHVGDRPADAEVFKVALSSATPLKSFKKTKTAEKSNAPSKSTGQQLSSSKLVPVALSLALMAGTGVAYQKGWLDGVIADLTPVDQALIAEHQAQAGRLQGEIKVMARRFDNGVRDLASELRDAERDNSTNLESLRFAQRLTEDYLVNGTIIPELEGKLAQAQTLLRTQNLNEQQSASALLLLEEVKNGYQMLWEEFGASKGLYANQTKAVAAKKQLDAYLSKRGYGYSEQAKEAQASYQRAVTARDEGRFAEASQAFMQSEPLLIQAFSASQDLYDGETKAAEAKKQLDAYLSKRGYGYSEQVKEAQASYERALAVSRAGHFAEAGQAFAQITPIFTQALSQSKQLTDARSTALKSRNALMAAIKKYSLPAPEQASAQAQLADGETFTQQGSYDKAAQSFASATQDYQALLDGLSGEIAKVEAKWAKAAKAAKAAKISNLVGKLVTIPAGSFMMGSNDGGDNEQPVHRVTLESFKMMEHEVTFALWDACVSDGGCRQRPGDKVWGRGNRPVMNVNYNDITNEFLPWLNKVTGVRFSLPSEAQWEYAARAGRQTKYSWGNDIGHNRANCDGCGSRWDNQQTAPVKSFPPNRWGLYDMHGNVWEWTQDCWNDNYHGAPVSGGGWRSGDCELRVLRGGSWNNYPRNLRSALRYNVSLGNRFSNIGFRLVQGL